MLSPFYFVDGCPSQIEPPEPFRIKANTMPNSNPTMIELWESLRLDEIADCGIRVRAHFRPLPRNFWSRLIGSHGFHCWFEVLDRQGQSLELERKFVWGVYEGRHKEGPKKGEHNGRARMKWMIWEYEEDGGLARWAELEGYRSGSLDVELKTLDRAAFTELYELVFEDRVIELGAYGYLRPLFGRSTGVWSCQSFVADYAKRHGGPKDLVAQLRARFGER